MLHGELNPRGELNGELTGGIFYGTMDYDELINKPTINGVELSGNKTTEDLGIIIPTKTSDLTNDSGYVITTDLAAVATSGSYNDLIDTPTIPTKTSDLTNDSGFITSAAVPTKTSDLTNDSGFITAASVPTKTSELINDNNFVSSSDLSAVAYSGDYDDLLNKPVIPTVPENLSDFNNDCGFIGFTDLTDTLTAGNTSITISDAAIETTSTIDIYTSVFGIQPTNALVSTGSITLTFLAQASDIEVKVRVS